MRAQPDPYNAAPRRNRAAESLVKDCPGFYLRTWVSAFFLPVAASMRLPIRFACTAIALLPAVAAAQGAGERGRGVGQPRADSLEGSLRSARAAAAAAPTSSAARADIGRALSALGRHEEALRAYAAASRLAPGDPVIWGLLAGEAAAVGRGREAVAYWERALVEAPAFFDTRAAERVRWEELVAREGPQPPARFAVEGGIASLAGVTTTANALEPTRTGYTSSGSGFLITADGYVLTNNHVVRGCAALRVRGDSGGTTKARVAGVDSSDDLAVLASDSRRSMAATFAAASIVRPGDDVIAVGYPLNGLLADEANVTTGSISALAGMYNDDRVLQMSAPVQPGSSGGPLFDRAGNIAGVVVTKLNAKIVAETMGDIPQNVNFAIKSSVARAFLDAQGIRYSIAPSITARSNAEIAEIGRRVTVLVECWR